MLFLEPFWVGHPLVTANGSIINMEKTYEVVCMSQLNISFLFLILMSTLGFMFLKFIGIEGIVRKKTGDKNFDLSLVYAGVLSIVLFTLWALSIGSVV